MENNDDGLSEPFVALQAKVHAQRQLTFAILASMPGAQRATVLRRFHELGAGSIALGVGRGVSSRDPVMLAMAEALEAMHLDLQELDDRTPG
jgi:hypothetical protein